MQVSMLEIIIGRIISLELLLPADSLSPIIVVGKSWKDTELITRSIIAEKLALPEPSSNFCIAFIPLGVAALPSPNIFDAIFIAMYLFVSGSFDLNKNFIIGDNNFSNFCPKPLLSTISNMPNHTA